ncbi:MAG: aminotransferase [Roseibacillus sp.]|jgi:aspartate aminotransferase-like enzyme|nr:aminotransferase [Roseibacillus sp.]MCP4729562.1 alanine--glyoxylate aminotransferase family protein [Roseibacillus sp.]MDP7306743.1 alanine--glyoxylate aminotransferase family protein [Roseibacillus sp.]HJM65031.1 alanine--glyoxylate aminotransferase family protein [Roseibacillus sp.]|tara:strand:- start:1132 stop:2211 length:1080 start_codon:yes stop_codon:yes gene_type:complete
MPKPKLFIPGPVDISPATYEAMCAPMIGHRGPDFEELYSSIQPGLQQIACTTRPVFLSTSSAWGVMEGAIRNLVQQKVLNLCCGAFSDKWFDVAQRCGKKAEKIQVEWGTPLDPDSVRSRLAEGGFDAVTLVHNETSTGVMNPLAEIADVVNEFDDVLLIVDSVSSFSAVPIATDQLGIDLLLAGVQKAMALPPGLSVFVASEAALARAESTPDRGYYFDFLEFARNHGKNNTPSTPSISLLQGLDAMVASILKEGLPNRYQRHAENNALVHQWVEERGFAHFAPEGYRSRTLTAVANNQEIDVPAFVKTVREKHNFLINGGYGKIKGRTFRLSNMGNETPESMKELLAALDDVLPEFV